MTFLDLSSNELCGLNKRGQGTYDATGIKAVADALSVSSSMKKLIIFKNYLGDEGIGIITAAVEGKEISLCGAEPGQTDLDLSKQGLGPDDAKIIAWELTTGFVSSSMTSLNMASNNLGGKVESNWIKGKSWAEGEEVEYEGFTWTCTRVHSDGDHKGLTRYDMSGIKALAEALYVNSSLNSLK